MSNCCCVTCFNRKFGYVDFASEEDMQKALELNGKKVMGQEVKLDKARSKDSSQENKKGKHSFCWSEILCRKVFVSGTLDGSEHSDLAANI